MDEKLAVSELLQRSEAFKSLKAETQVAECLERLGWLTVQSPYYADHKTGKLRELDVIASAYWIKNRSSDSVVARVNVFVEVKSNADFHILCAGSAPSPKRFEENEYWIGYSDEVSKRLESLLSKHEFKREEVLSYLQVVEKIAFPRSSMRTAVLRIAPLR